MYNPLRKIKSMYKNYSAEEGLKVLTVGGAVAGGVAGLALPLYVGWELGDYVVKNLLEFDTVLGYATKVMGACLLTAGVSGVTVPIGTIAGMATGAGVGTVAVKAKKSLESLVSKN